MYGFQPGFDFQLGFDSVWAGVRDRLISPRDMRSGRRYLARRRALAQRQETRVFIGRRADNLYVFHVDR